MADEQSLQDVAMGELVAEELGKVVGVGLSPALGLAVVGAWHRYGSDTPIDRWYTSPWFIWFMAFLAALVAGKDILGSVAGPLKQVADAGEVLLNKVTGSLGLVATMGYAAEAMGVPMASVAQGVIDVIAPVAHAAGPAAEPGVLSELAVTLGSLVASALGGIAYSAVWLTSQTFNVMVMLNPFSLLDPVLKGARLTLVAAVSGACAISPWLGVPICLAYILFAFIITGFCVRMLSFGTLMAWDLVRLKKGQAVDTDSGLVAFAGRGLKGVPSRSLGVLKPSPQEGTAVFRYRPLLIMKWKEVDLPTADLHAVDGALYACLSEDAEGRGRAVIDLPPRYRKSSEHIAQYLHLAGVGRSWLDRTLESGSGLMGRLVNQLKELPSVLAR